jgi:hypothetical protein
MQDQYVVSNEHTDSHAGTLLNECSSSLYALIALFQDVTQCTMGSHNTCGMSVSTYSLQYVLIYASVAEWLKIFPIE